MKAEYLASLPDRPYCTDRFGKLLIRAKDKAAGFPIIQHNHPTTKAWMVFDIDADFAWFRADECGMPDPTFTAINRTNGHAHIGYQLDTPVSFYDASRREPIAFYEAVQMGFTKRLGSDRGYAGFLSKNPLSPEWEVDWQARIPYPLSTLNDYLDPKDKKRPIKIEESALGRNVTVFDTVRKIAYTEVLKIKKRGGTQEELEAKLRSIAAGVNQTFKPLMLSQPEIKCICRSVTKFVWNKFTLEKFSAIQTARIRKRWAGVQTLESQKPWVEKGISRMTWFRQQRRIKQHRERQEP